MTQCHRLSLCVLGGRYPAGTGRRSCRWPLCTVRMSSALLIHVCAPSSGSNGLFRSMVASCAAFRPDKLLLLTFPPPVGIFLVEAFPRGPLPFSALEPLILGNASSFICPTFERCSPVISSMLRPAESCSLLTFKAFRSISAVKSSPLAAFGPVVFRCPFPPVVNSFSVTTSCRYSL